jgi:hypothetical protein
MSDEVRGNIYQETLRKGLTKALEAQDSKPIERDLCSSSKKEAVELDLLDKQV